METGHTVTVTRYMAVYTTTRALLATTLLPLPSRTHTHTHTHTHMHACTHMHAQTHITHHTSVLFVVFVVVNFENWSNKITARKSDQLLILFPVYIYVDPNQ